MKDITRKYTNGEVTIVWKPDLCIHSGNCVRGLPEVFKPNDQPWINPEAADTRQLKAQVDQCPSGALSYFMNAEAGEGEPQIETERIVELMSNGPLMVYGNLSIKDAEGNVTKKSKVTAFCRCGSSENKPFCDGTHKKIGWEG